MRGNHDNLTLQEYIQAHNIRKKINERKRSNSKGKITSLKDQQPQKSKTIFQMIDRYQQEWKIDLSQMLQNTELIKDKLFFSLSSKIDGLLKIIKEQIVQILKDVYAHYLIENENHKSQIVPQNVQYYQKKIQEATNSKKKINEIIKQKYKAEQKNQNFINMIFGFNIPPPELKVSIFQEAKPNQILPAKSVGKQGALPQEKYSQLLKIQSKREGPVRNRNEKREFNGKKAQSKSPSAGSLNKELARKTKTALIQRTKSP